MADVAHSFQFVDAISATPTVLLDIDDLAPFWVVAGSSVSPPRLRRSTSQGLSDGSVETGSSYDDRVLRIVLKPQTRTIAEDQSAAIQTLVRILDQREGAWLKWQATAKDEPVFYRTKRADVEVIDEVLDARPDRQLNLEIPAHPFAYGLPVTGSFTITNDPTSGDNPMLHAWDNILGDVPTPLHLTFPTPDAAHRITVASNALYGTPDPVVRDSFDRANSTTSLGSPDVGSAWAAYAGTWGIIDNQAYCPTDTAGYAAAVVDSGAYDCTVEATFVIGVPGANTHGLWLRSSDINNGFFAAEANLFRRQASVDTNLGAYTDTFNAGDRMRVVMLGDILTVFRQTDATGPWVEVLSVTDSNMSANTKHGLAVFGTSGDEARFDDFRVTPGPQTVPYYKSMSDFPKKDPAPTGWTISDVASTAAIGGFRRLLSSADGHDPLLVPTQATMLQWTGLPPGDYRVMARINNANAGVEILFWNRPPKTGSALIKAEAAASALVVNSTSNWDWYDLGVVAMPGGAPLGDAAFGLGAVTSTGLWNLGVYNPNNNNLNLDAVMLVPAGRAGTVTRHSSTAFPDTFTNKTVTLDGVNNRRFALGESVNAAGVQTPLAATELSGGLPIVAPGAENVMHFFATAADPASATRVNDDKTTTTVVDWMYFPRYLYDRPSAS